MGTGQSFCNFMRLKCTGRIQWSQCSSEQQELKRSSPKCCKCMEKLRT